MTAENTGGWQERVGHFVEWLKAHDGRLQGCEIRPCTSTSPLSSLSPGLGVFSTSRIDDSSITQSDTITDLELLLFDVPKLPPVPLPIEPTQDFPAAATELENTRKNDEHSASTQQEKQAAVDHFHGDAVLMTVPFSLVISKHNTARCPLFGRHLSALIDADVIDDRTAVVLFLALHRALGPDSLYYRYLSLLPSSFSTPLWFPHSLLHELKGTPLHDATVAQKKQLEARFAAISDFCLAAGMDDVINISFQHFLWAHSIFWSRCMSLPVPVLAQVEGVREHEGARKSLPVPVPAQVEGVRVVVESARVRVESASEGVTDAQGLGEGEGEDGESAAVGREGERGGVRLESAGSAVQAGIDAGDGEGLRVGEREHEGAEVAGREAGGKQGRVEVVEALVPGIDMCNHALRPSARWDVAPQRLGSDLSSPPAHRDGGSGHLAVRLLQGQNRVLSAPRSNDGEITISYGDKGNEELLFLYGFVIPANPHETIMIRFPPSKLHDDPWAELKMHLLALQGLSPQWLLTAQQCSVAHIWHCRSAGTPPHATPNTTDTAKVPAQATTAPLPASVAPAVTAANTATDAAAATAANTATVVSDAANTDAVPTDASGAAGLRPDAILLTALPRGSDSVPAADMAPRVSDGSVPADVLAGLRVLAMGEVEAEAALNLLQEVKSANGDAELTPADAELAVQRAVGSDRLALELLASLLQERLQAMEEATGSLTDDLNWLQGSRSKASPATARSGDGTGEDNSQAGGTSELYGGMAGRGVQEGVEGEEADCGFTAGGASVTELKLLCVEYRCGQKRLTEAWLSLARRLKDDL